MPPKVNKTKKNKNFPFFFRRTADFGVYRGDLRLIEPEYLNSADRQVVSSFPGNKHSLSKL